MRVYFSFVTLLVIGLTLLLSSADALPGSFLVPEGQDELSATAERQFGRRPSPSPSRKPQRHRGPCKGFRARRKEILDMSSTEYNNYVKALTTLRKNGVLEKFVGYHSTYARLSHGGCLFLPWHRAFLFEFERELNKVSPGVYIPYWDWTKIIPGTSTQVGATFTRDTIWDRMGGGAGNAAIPKAPFQNWRVGSLQVLRDFRQNNGNVGGRGSRFTFPTSQMLATQVAGRDSFDSFTTLLEAEHGTPHVAVGGNMGSVPTSPSDPIFWSHHAFIDSIWLRWQNSGNGNKFSCSLNANLPPFGKTVNQVFTEIQQCTTYEPSSRAGPTSRLSLVDRQNTGTSLPSAGASVLQFSPQKKKDLLEEVAQEKTDRPSQYRAQVKKGLDVLDSTVQAAEAFGMSPDRVEKAKSSMQNLLLTMGADVVNDKKVVNQDDGTIAAQGKAQAAALEAGSTPTPSAPSAQASTTQQPSVSSTSKPLAQTSTGQQSSVSTSQSGESSSVQESSSSNQSG